MDHVASVNFVDAFDGVLDKGIVIDAALRVSLAGIDFLAVDARVVVASIETYMTRFADVMLQATPAEPPMYRTREAPRIPANNGGLSTRDEQIGSMAETEPNPTRTIQAAFRAWNAHDPSRYAALLHEDYIGETRAVPTLLRGRHAASRAMRMKLKLFPDLRFVIHDVILKGETALVSWVATGTRDTARVNVPGCTIGSMRNGKIRHTWCYWDADDMLAPLRVMSRATTDDPPTVHRFDTSS